MLPKLGRTTFLRPPDEGPSFRSIMGFAIRVKIPGITISSGEKTKLLSKRSVSANGWNPQTFSSLLTQIKTIYDNLLAALDLPPPIAFSLDPAQAAHPNQPLDLSLSRTGVTFTIYLGGERDSQFILDNIARSLCENLGYTFLTLSIAGMSSEAIQSAFVNGIGNNPYLTGLKLEPTPQLATLPDRAEDANREDVLMLMAATLPVLLRTRIVQLLHPSSSSAYSEQMFSAYAERTLALLTSELSTPERPGPTSFSKMVIALASDAALAEARSLPQVAQLIEEGLLNRLVPIEASNAIASGLASGEAPASWASHPELTLAATLLDLKPKTQAYFLAVKQTYLAFVEGVAFR
ncbi:MAG: hypothetical protein HQ596_07275 [Candidatus Saganbacteria bacterium]|nr:hypothetical protein [Candidatus Saganbacteria bacterium]